MCYDLDLDALPLPRSPMFRTAALEGDGSWYAVLIIDAPRVRSGLTALKELVPGWRRSPELTWKPVFSSLAPPFYLCFLTSMG